MSVNTLMNALPKKLREELKQHHLYVGCFTDDTKRATVKPSHLMLVPQGIEQMVKNRQELLLLGYTTGQTRDAVVELLREIEVLRYTAMLMKKA